MTMTVSQTLPGAPDGSRLNPAYTFEEFVVGPHNRFPHAAALAVSDNLGRAYNPLFVYGAVGIGKTHLMQAVGHRVRARLPVARILYVTAQTFLTEVIEMVQAGNLNALRERYRSLDLLLVDDIQFLATSEATQEEFFHMFNDLHNTGRQIIMTSDRPPKMLTTLEDRLRNRFEWGLIADIKPTNLETRVAILKKKETHLTGVNLGDDIRLFVAGRLKSNVRELEGFLRRVQAYSQLNNQPITLELVKEIMRELLPPGEWIDDGPGSASPEAVPAANGAGGAPPPPSVASPAPLPPVAPPPAAGPVELTPLYPVPPPPAPAPAAPPRPEMVVDLRESLGMPGAAASPAPPATPIEAPFYAPPSAPELPPKPPEPIPMTPSPAPNFRPRPVPMPLPEVQKPTVVVAILFPEGQRPAVDQMKAKFDDIIKKHKLKFQLLSGLEQQYPENPALSGAALAEVCAQSRMNVALVVGTPPRSPLPEAIFHDRLLEAFNARDIAFHFIPWDELGKDYRYLNIALDIRLLGISQKR
jgi:Holliday junction resolvasome RuvABC ATP-dependent DNA helicase subunit